MWWDVILAGASGALAVLIASLVLLKNYRGNRIAYIVVVLIAFFVLNTLSRTYVLPEIRDWQARREVSKFFEENRFYSLLASRHPEIREQFSNLYTDSMRSGTPKDEVLGTAMEWGRQVMTPYLRIYIPNASNEALTNFVSFSVEILDQLKEREDDACFVWLFGGNTSTQGDIRNSITESEEKRMWDVMADVLESAISSPQYTTDVNKAMKLMETLVNGLVAKHGVEFIEVLAMLEQPQSPNVDRKAVCNVASELYHEALLVPEGDRGDLLRYLLAPEGVGSPER